MENKKFDQFIKQAMENLDGEQYIPQDWSFMEEHLDASVNDIDQLVQQSMDKLDGGNYIPMDWSLMENKLDAEIGANADADAAIDPQMEDIYLDAVAYEHLNNIETPYNKEHWKIMSARLDEEYAYRRRVIFTKTLEAAVVLLLVWTAINFFPTKKTNSTTTTKFPIATIPSTHHNNTNNLNPLQPSNQLSSEDNIVTNDAASQPTLTAELTTPSPIVEDFSSEKNQLASVEPFSQQIPPVVKDRIEDAPILSDKQLFPLIKIEDEDTSNSPSTNSVGSVLAQKDASILEEKLLVQISPLPSLMSSLLANDDSEKNKFRITDFLKKKLRTHEMFFSMFSSLDFNYVQSDFYNPAVREWDVYQRDQYGYSGGFALGFQLNRFLIETGASYNFVSYQLQNDATIIGSFTEGYVEEQWENAELNMLQVPLNIQYAFLAKRKWRMYSLTGVSLNMALQNNFNFQLEDKTTATRSPSVDQSMIANQAAAYKGIFEGGSLRKNSYLTANIGLGLERKFTYRWSLFVQPVYRHYFLFDGIGPKEDRIHSGSVIFGAKVKIR